MPWRVAVALAVAMLPFAGPVRAADTSQFSVAEGGQVEAVTLDTGSRRISAIEIHFAPYRDDPARSRYEKFAEKAYIFMLSDDVAGKVIELRSELSAPPGASGKAREIVIAETLRCARER